jgi:hypothetical protein
MTDIVKYILVGLALVVAIFLWLQWSYPVLYERGISPQQIQQWSVIALENWHLSGSFYELAFQGKAAIGSTAYGPTVLILLGEGQVRVEPSQAQKTGKLTLGSQPRMELMALKAFQGAFSQGYLRLSPQDPQWPQGALLKDPEAQKEAQTIHQEKLPRYLSAGDKVRIPQRGVRVLELETEQGALLLLDSPRQTAVYWLSP